MKKTLIALALATAGVFAVPAVFAQSSSPNGGLFISGNLGNASLSNDRYDGDDMAWGISGGYRWAVNPRFAIGAEVGYNDLGNINTRDGFGSKTSLDGWTTGVNARFEMTPSWYLTARTGLYFWDGKGLAHDLPLARVSTDDTGWYAGAGVGYNVARNFSIGVNYDYYDASKDHVDLDTNVWSVSAEYRF